MDTLFIPNENDFRRWIREALKECLENLPIKEGATADRSPAGALAHPQGNRGHFPGIAGNSP